MKEKNKTRKAANNAAKHSTNPKRFQRYMERFVNNTGNIPTNKKYKVIEIAPENALRIRRILLMSEDGTSCSVKAFVNNVLAEHFEKYADVINKIIES